MSGLEGKILEDDSLAHILGTFCLSTVFAHLERTVDLLSGYPKRFVLLPSEKPNVRARELAVIRKDYELYLQLKAWTEKVAFDFELLKRHPFQLTAVMQVIHGLLETNWEVNVL